MTRELFIALVFVLLQLLIGVFAYSLRWLAGRELVNVWVIAALFAAFNGLLALAVARVFEGGFAVLATSLALLWIWFMNAVGIGVLHKLFPAADNLWKPALPLLFAAISTWAWFNAHSPVVRHYSIQIDKPLAKPVRILLASDLHLGNQVGNPAIEKLIAIASAEKPDIIVMPGDIINDDDTPYEAQKMYETLGRLYAPLGVYATLGNHESYGNLAKNAAAIEKSGAVLLRDARVQTGDLTIIGREDNTNHNRKPLAALLPADTSAPIIVLDHQPKDIETAANLPVDIVVSGHTHKGQIFPANFITKKLYRLDYGYEKIGSTDFFTTSGFGFWGLPLRLGSRSEVFVIDVAGKN